MHLHVFLERDGRKLLGCANKRTPKPVITCKLFDVEIRTLGGSCYHLESSLASLDDFKDELACLTGIPVREQRLFVGCLELAKGNFCVLAASPIANLIRRPPKQVEWMEWLDNPRLLEADLLSHFENAPDYIRDDHDVLLAATQISGLVFQFVGDAVRSDRQFILKVLAGLPKKARSWFHLRNCAGSVVTDMFKSLPDDMYQDLEVILAAVMACRVFASQLHQFAFFQIRSNRELILAAIQSAGHGAVPVYTGAPDALRADSGVMLATIKAVRNLRPASVCELLDSAPGNVLAEKKVVLELLASCDGSGPEAFVRIPEQHRCDLEVVLAALRASRRADEVFAVLPKTLRGEQAVVLAALHGLRHPKDFGRVLALRQKLVPKFRKDTAIVMTIFCHGSAFLRGWCTIASDAWSGLSRSLLPLKGQCLPADTRAAVSQQQKLALLSGRYHLHQLRQLRERMTTSQPQILRQVQSQPPLLDSWCDASQMGQMRPKECSQRQRLSQNGGRRKGLVCRRRHCKLQAMRYCDGAPHPVGIEVGRKQWSRGEGIQQQRVSRRRAATNASQEWHDREWHDREWQEWDEFELTSGRMDLLHDYY